MNNLDRVIRSNSPARAARAIARNPLLIREMLKRYQEQDSKEKRGPESWLPPGRRKR